MADETTLRLRIEADATGLNASLNATEGQLRGFEAETKRVEAQLQQTAQAADAAGRQIVQMGESTHISFGRLQAGMVGATVAGNALFEAFDQLARAIAAPISEILDAEESAALLAGTFQGVQTEIEQVISLAKELSAVGPIFDDDNLSRAAAALRLYGANADAIQQLLPYANNLAMAFGIDVSQAAELMGQALNGQVRALGRLVPELRTATSQAEVLAAIESTFARNAQIAEQRMAGLGGQLALVKRQAGDAAQAFGNIFLPALSGVLAFLNENMMPALGKLGGMMAGLITYFSSLGKGLSISEVFTRAGEAILQAEASFARVEPKIIKTAGNIRGALKDLQLQGTFADAASKTTAAGRAAAPAAIKAVRGAEVLGPEVPFSMRLETFGMDPATKEARDKAEQEQIEADRRAHREAMQQIEQQRLATFKYMKQEADAKKKAADELNAYYLESAIQIGTSIGNVFKKAFSGARVTEADVQGLLGDVAVLTAGVIGGAIGGRETGEVAARIARPVTDALLPIVSVLGKGLLGINALQEKANQQALDATNEQIRASQLQVEAALVQAEAAKKQQEAAAGAVIGSQERRRAAVGGEASLAAFDIFQALSAIPGGGLEGLIAKTIRGASEAQLATFGELAKTALGTGPAAIEAGNRLANALTGGRAPFLQNLGGIYEVQELLLQLAERFGPSSATDALQPGGIQNGTSPDRPVYVFDVRPREGFGFAPESFFFRNRGAGTSRAVAGNPLPAAQAAPVTPRVTPVRGGARGRAAG